MRVLFLVSSMQGGGAERVAALLCNHWAGRRHDVTLMPTFSGRGECIYPLDERVRVEFLADRVSSRKRSILNRLRRYVALRKALHEFMPDVIVSFLPHVNIAAVLSAWGLRIPVVVSERVYPPAMPLGKGMELLRRFAYSHAGSVVVQTEGTRRWLKECCPRTVGHVIPNPVVYPLPSADPVRDPASVMRDGGFCVLAAGRLERQKGFDRLLYAFGEVAQRHPDWDVIVLGDGPERGALTEQRDALGLTERVHLPGHVGNPGDWYARADCFAMSSRFEGFPNTLLEAMAHGLPAVSFDCETGPADIIRDGVDGYLVAPQEGAKGLAAAMETVMRDSRMRERMGEEAVAVRERFGPERVMVEWDRALGLL